MALCVRSRVGPMGERVKVKPGHLFSEGVGIDMQPPRRFSQAGAVLQDLRQQALFIRLAHLFEAIPQGSPGMRHLSRM